MTASSQPLRKLAEAVIEASARYYNLRDTKSLAARRMQIIAAHNDWLRTAEALTPHLTAKSLLALLDDLDRTREGLRSLVEAVEIEVNEKGAGGFLLARLSDARKALT